MLKWIGFGLAGAIGLILAVAALAHTPPARAAALRAAVRALHELGFELRAEGLRYNLRTLTADLEKLEIAATRTPADPFFAADRVVIELPWHAVLRRSFALDSLEVISPRLTIHRGLDGLLNLPSLETANDTTASAPIGRLDVGQLIVRDLDAT